MSICFIDVTSMYNAKKIQLNNSGYLGYYVCGEGVYLKLMFLGKRPIIPRLVRENITCRTTIMCYVAIFITF